MRALLVTARVRFLFPLRPAPGGVHVLVRWYQIGSCAHAHTRTRAHTHTRTRARAHTPTRPHAHAHAHAHAHERAHAHAHAHPPAPAPALAPAPACTRTRTRTRTYKHAHTHTQKANRRATNPQARQVERPQQKQQTKAGAANGAPTTANKKLSDGANLGISGQCNVDLFNLSSRPWVRGSIFF